MATWHWVTDYARTKELVELDALPTSLGAYTPTEYLDLVPAKETRTFSGEGFLFSDLMGVIAAMNTFGGTYSLTDNHGVNHTGKPVSFSFGALDGSGSYYKEVRLVMKALTV